MFLSYLPIEMLGFTNKSIKDVDSTSVQEIWKSLEKLTTELEEERDYGTSTDNNNNNNNDRISRTFNPFDNLKFSGLDDVKHPARFLEFFEYFALQENLDEYEKKYHLMRCFVGDAEDWINSRGLLGTYKEMRRDFLKFYWSPAIQRSFMNYLKVGEYDEDSGLSVTGYFFKYANYAKFLDVAIAEEDVVFDLLNHYKVEEMQSLLRLRPVKTIDEALAILTRMEDFQSFKNSTELISGTEETVTEKSDFRSFKKPADLPLTKSKEENKRSELTILRFLICVFVVFLFGLLYSFFFYHSSDKEIIIAKQQKLLEEFLKFD